MCLLSSFAYTRHFCQREPVGSSPRIMADSDRSGSSLHSHPSLGTESIVFRLLNFYRYRTSAVGASACLQPTANTNPDRVGRARCWWYLGAYLLEMAGAPRGTNTHPHENDRATHYDGMTTHHFKSRKIPRTIFMGISVRYIDDNSTFHEW